MAQDKGGAKGSTAKATPKSPRKKRRDLYTIITDKRIATTAAGLSTITGNKNQAAIMRVAKSLVTRWNAAEMRGGATEGFMQQGITSGVKKLSAKGFKASEVRPKLVALVQKLQKGTNLRNWNENPTRSTHYKGSVWSGIEPNSKGRATGLNRPKKGTKGYRDAVDYGGQKAGAAPLRKGQPPKVTKASATPKRKRKK